jgi:hypothetical protein
MRCKGGAKGPNLPIRGFADRRIVIISASDREDTWEL